MLPGALRDARHSVRLIMRLLTCTTSSMRPAVRGRTVAGYGNNLYGGDTCGDSFTRRSTVAMRRKR